MAETVQAGQGVKEARLLNGQVVPCWTPNVTWHETSVVSVLGCFLARFYQLEAYDV